VSARARRTALRTTLAAAAAVLAVGLTPSVAFAAPAAPTANPAEVAAALAQADQLTAQIARLTAQATAAQNALEAAHVGAALALDDYQATQAAYDAARSKASAAAAAAARATARLASARADLVAFARRSYMQGTTDSRTQALLTSLDPTDLIERSALLAAAGDHTSTVFAEVTAARAEAVRTAAFAKATLASADVLQARASAALQVAEATQLRARTAAASLLGQQLVLDRQVTAARTTLTGLIGDGAAAQRLAGLVLTPVPGPIGPDPFLGDSRRPAGKGSPAIAAAAIDAAVAELGTSYAWGGGGAQGPSGGLPPDDGVVGFDCSGLTQYAYARAGVSIPRNSRSQFAALPKVAIGDLQPGDLVFWATNPGDPRTIHHVALYLGDGRVLEAPESGGIVRVTAMWWDGYAGAARPTG
jgi:cell wall-associated NlpC family hydrolase